MSNRKKSITLNFTSILFGRGIGLFLNLFAVVLVARILGTEKYGLFAAILSTVNILTKFIDLGLSPIVTRETAKDLKNFSFVNNAISIRIILFLLLIVISNLFFFFIGTPTEEIIYSNILFANIILSSRFLSFRELLEIPFKVNLKMHIVTALNFIDNFLLLGLVFLIPYFDNKLLFYVIIFTAANVPGFLALLYLLKKKLGYKFHFQLEKSSWLIKQSLPLIGYVLFLSLFQQLDIVLTKNFISNSASGIYSTGVRLTQPFTIFPVAIVTTVIPLIVAGLKEKKDNLKNLIVLVYKLLFLISFLTAVIFSFKAKSIVGISFGEKYLASTPVVIILAWSNLFLFFNFFTVELLTVFGKQRYNFFFAGILVITDIALFFLLYDKLNEVGVALARTLATVAGAFFLKIVQQKIYKKIRVVNVRVILFIVLVLGFSWLLKDTFLLLFILAVVIFFSITALRLQVLTKEEMEMIFSIFKIDKFAPSLKKLILKIYR